MHILLVGVTGFIGGHVALALESAGHRLRCTTRRVPPAGSPGEAPARQWLHVEDADMLSVPAWQRALTGIDMVVYAVGVFHDGRSGDFDRLHHRVPAALYQACVQSGVRRVVHFSALGADASARSAYHLSKRAGDEALLASGIDAVVLQPSLVFGLDGASASAFLRWAALPWLPVPAGAGEVQPVHIDDVVDLVVRAASDAPPSRGRLAVVGPHALSVGDYLQALRRAMGLPPARCVKVPAWAMELAARAGRRLPGSLLTPESWEMLKQGNSAPPGPFAQALGRQPRRADGFLGAAERGWVRQASRAAPALWLLRWSIATVWLVTAGVSVAAYRVSDSLALLQRAGATGTWAMAMLYGAAALDLLLGLATLWWPRAWVWWSQIVLIVFYTGIISWRLPEFWAHPYGPVLKNLPMLAGLALLLVLEPRRR